LFKFSLTFLYPVLYNANCNTALICHQSLTVVYAAIWISKPNKVKFNLECHANKSNTVGSSHSLSAMAKLLVYDSTVKRNAKPKILNPQ